MANNLADNQNLSMCNKARVLAKQFDKLETALLCKYWNCILQRFNATSTALKTLTLISPKLWIWLQGSLLQD